MPYIWKDTDKTQPLDRGFTTSDGTQYPSNWIRLSTPEDKEAIGLEWVNDDRPRVNERYYQVRGKRGDWTVLPMDLDKAKKRDIGDAKRAAGEKLSGSDWMVVRAAESDKPVGEDWSAWRESIREHSNDLEASINDAADVDALAGLKQDWPKSPAEIESEAAGNGPIGIIND